MPDAIIIFNDQPTEMYVRLEDCLLTYEDAHLQLVMAGFSADQAVEYLRILPVEKD